MIKNAKFSGYYFDMNLIIWGDFQICISVPLSSSLIQVMKKYPYNYLDDSFFKRRFKNNSVSLNIFTENEERQIYKLEV